MSWFQLGYSGVPRPGQGQGAALSGGIMNKWLESGEGKVIDWCCFCCNADAVAVCCSEECERVCSIYVLTLTHSHELLVGIKERGWKYKQQKWAPSRGWLRSPLSIKWVVLLFGKDSDYSCDSVTATITDWGGLGIAFARAIKSLGWLRKAWRYNLPPEWAEGGGWREGGLGLECWLHNLENGWLDELCDPHIDLFWQILFGLKFFFILLWIFWCCMSIKGKDFISNTKSTFPS